MAKQKTTVLTDIKDLFQERSNFFVGFISSLIIVTGITIINNPSKWWISVLSVSVIAVLLLIFLNAKIIIKVVTSFIALILVSAATFKIGAMIDPTGSNAFLWMMLTLTTFFLELFLSYILSSTNGRWGATTISTLFGVFITFVVVSLGINFTLSIGIGTLFSIITFILWYKYGSKQSYKIKKMPEIVLPNSLIEKIVYAAADKKWSLYLPTKFYRSNIITWDKETAFIITGVELKQKFGMGGRKGDKLVYDGENVNPWLLNLIQKLTPNNIRNSHLMLVLLDYENKNGSEPKVIGIQAPDSNKRIPVGIMPAKGLTETPNKLLSMIKENFEDYVIELSEKQYNHLNKVYNNIYEDEIELSDKNEEKVVEQEQK